MSYQTQQQGGFLSSIPPIVKNLIIINVLFFLATLLFEEPMMRYMALYYPESSFFMPHQLFTHMFMHGGYTHILFNMYALWMFGSPLEHAWGPKRFLAFYIICGIGASLLYIFVQWIQLTHLQSVMTPESLAYMKGIIHQADFTDTVAKLRGGDIIPYAIHTSSESSWFNIMTTPLVGASGAIFGVLLGFGMLFPNTVLQLLLPPVRLKAKYFVMIYGAVELYLSVSQPGDSVAHAAHVGGMIFGFILIKLWSRKSKKKQNNHHWN